MERFDESRYRLVNGSPTPNRSFAVFHIHTTDSDGFESAEEHVERAERIGISTLIFLDHNRGAAFHIGRDYAKLRGIPVEIIPGREVNSGEGHIGSIGTDQEIETGLPAEDTNRLIFESKGKAAALHVGDKVTDSVFIETVKRANSNLDPKTHFAFVEDYNGATLKIENLVLRPLIGRIARLSPRGRKVDFSSVVAQKFMEEEGEIYNLRRMTGPDAHYGEDFADVVMGYPAGEDFMEAALQGRTWVLVKKEMFFPSLRRFQAQKKLEKMRNVSLPVV